MIRWLRHVRDLELAPKLIITYCLLLILPLGLTGYIAFHTHAASLEENVGRFAGELVKQLTVNLDTYVSELDKLTISAYQSKEILAFLQKPRRPGERVPLATINELNEFVSGTIWSGRVDIKGVGLFGEQGASFLALAENPYDYAARLADDYPDLYERMKERSGGAALYRTHTVRTSRGSVYEVFSIGRQIKNLETGKPIGYILLEVDLNGIRTIARQVSLGRGENIIIVDENGRPVYEKNPVPIPREITETYRGAGTTRIERDGEVHLVAYYTSPRTGWTTFGMVPVAELTRDTELVKNAILWIGSFCVGLGLLLFIFIARRMTRPIRTMRSMMKRVEDGDLSVSFPVASRDEVGELGRAFNVMVSRLSELGYKLYELELREKEAQIAALQSQINPHFLYNTLGAIAMFAEVQGNREVVQMTQNLSKLLRYSIHSNRDQVPLREEVARVKEYMAIHKIRFEERIRFQLDVEEELLDVPVIRLILQPLVENAVSHGMEKGTGYGTVRLSARRAGDRMVITVEDDGTGMTEAEVKRLTERMQAGERPDGTEGHGLVNVHRRLLLHYGPGFGLAVASEPGAGTRVTLHVPIAAEQEGTNRSGHTVARLASPDEREPA